MKFVSLAIIPILLAVILASGQNDTAFSSGNLKIIKVIGHHFTTSLNNGRHIIYVKNPSEGRYIVIKLAVEVLSDDLKIFTNDFVLQYFHQDGKEDRSKCSSICQAKTSQLSEDDGCAIGNAAWVLLHKETKYLILVFFLENDVNSIIIGRIDAAPLRYQVGSDRPFSVFISTNQGSEILSKTEMFIRAGGYQVTRTSTRLSDEEKGVTIHYVDGAEIQAREISQRIMTEIGITPVVKKMNLISDNDIVVWLGK